jgi:hypothetical protein
MREPGGDRLMSGSHVAVIVMPIVIAICLAFWISLVYYATAHPKWKRHSRPPRTEVAGGVFEATHSGRQLSPLWGEPVDGIPSPRPASASETYQPADAEQERVATGASATGGAYATGSRPPGESGPTGSGWPRE